MAHARDDTDPVDRALHADRNDVAGALQSVLPLVYGELREIARRTLAGSGPHSVQATDLVHEAFLRLARDRSGWADRSNLMVAAAVAMRRTLVDHLRRRRAAKRGGGVAPTDELDTIVIHDHSFDTLALEEALQRLAVEEPASAQVAELRLFGGLDPADCARALDVSKRTIERRWRFARAWLVTELYGRSNDD
ncbi:MAG: ECF-type sigma factor [Planctomycetota bacterium]